MHDKKKKKSKQAGLERAWKEFTSRLQSFFIYTKWLLNDIDNEEGSKKEKRRIKDRLSMMMQVTVASPRGAGPNTGSISVVILFSLLIIPITARPSFSPLHIDSPQFP